MSSRKLMKIVRDLEHVRNWGCLEAAGQLRQTAKSELMQIPQCLVRVRAQHAEFRTASLWRPSFPGPANAWPVLVYSTIIDLPSKARVNA